MTTIDPPGSEEVMEFPLEFPLKIMGRNNDLFRETVTQLLAEHLSDPAAISVAESVSSNGGFVSMTVTFTATSRAQLDAIYVSVTASPVVLYTL